jgi:hypothetical protein
MHEDREDSWPFNPQEPRIAAEGSNFKLLADMNSSGSVLRRPETLPYVCTRPQQWDCEVLVDHEQRKRWFSHIEDSPACLGCRTVGLILGR